MVYYFLSHLEMLILVTAGLTKSDGTATEKVLPDTNILLYTSFSYHHIQNYRCTYNGGYCTKWQQPTASG